jgi:exonuclease VII small subunit
MWADLWEVEAARNAWGRIGELFVEKALITGSELEQALAVQAAGGRPLGEVLVSQGLISSPEMTEVLLEQLGRKVAKEEECGSALWSEIRRRTSRMPERPLATTAESADELNQRISQLIQHLADTQLALDQERAAYESARAEAAATKRELGTAEKRIGELAVIVDRLQAERDERSEAAAKRRRTIKRTLFGPALRLAQE